MLKIDCNIRIKFRKSLNIRLFKKIKDLECYCDIDKCMELLSQPLIYETQAQLNPRHFGFYFSHKYTDMYKEYYPQLKPYFKTMGNTVITPAHFT